MNIAIDGRAFLYARTGIEYSISQILKMFLEYHGEHEYLLYGAKGLGRNLVNQCRKRGRSILDNIQPVPFPFRKLSRYYLELTTSLAINKADVQVFWGPNYRGVFSKKFKTVITIHDMAHIHYPDYTGKHNYHFFTRYLKEHSRESTRILCPSNVTKSDIVNYLEIPEEKVRVIYWGVDSHFRPVEDEVVVNRVKNRYGLIGDFILFVGTIQPRKNIEGLLEAFWILNEKKDFSHKLIIAGCKGWKYSEIFNRIEAYGLKEKVKWLGYVDYEDLPGLYSLADVLVLPSYYEGFGFPILEAMACGTPVVTSNVSSMPEVAGDAAILVDPNSPEMIAESIRQVLMDSELNQKLRETGLMRAKEFTWEKSADEIMAVFDEVVRERP